MSKMNMAAGRQMARLTHVGWTELSVLLRGKRYDDYNESEDIIQEEGKERPTVATSGDIRDSTVLLTFHPFLCFLKQ